MYDYIYAELFFFSFVAFLPRRGFDATRLVHKFVLNKHNDVGKTLRKMKKPSGMCEAQIYGRIPAAPCSKRYASDTNSGKMLNHKLAHSSTYGSKNAS